MKYPQCNNIWISTCHTVFSYWSSNISTSAVCRCRDEALTVNRSSRATTASKWLFKTPAWRQQYVRSGLANAQTSQNSCHCKGNYYYPLSHLHRHVLIVPSASIIPKQSFRSHPYRPKNQRQREKHMNTKRNNKREYALVKTDKGSSCRIGNMARVDELAVSCTHLDALIKLIFVEASCRDVELDERRLPIFFAAHMHPINKWLIIHK